MSPSNRIRCASLVLALVLSACGSSTISVYLNSSESTAPLRQPLAATETLIRAKQVRLTVETAALHFAPTLVGDVGDPAGDAGWTEVLDTPLVIDLMNLRADQTKLLGEGVLPAATKLTQVRLRLRSDGEGPNDTLRVKNAVIDVGDRTCDLLLPKTAADPGLSVEGGLDVAARSEHVDVVLSLRLDDSVEVTDDFEAACTWTLRPVLYLRPSAPADGETP